MLTNAAIPYRPLIDFSWRFGVTIATNDVLRAGATYVQLRLVFAGGHAENMELSLPQFYSMLAALEKSKSYAAFLSGSSDSSPSVSVH